MGYLILLAFLLITGWVSYYISKRVFLLLQKNGNKYSREIQILIAIILFLLFVFIAVCLIATNAEMGR